MQAIYSFLIRSFGLGARISAVFNRKSRQWVEGRKNWRHKLETGTGEIHSPIWVHCSSMGEFEQARPVIEAFHQRGEKVVLTFFSPSGYRNLREYKFADYVTYLPLDTRRNARQFLKIVKPKAAIFIKYEFWFNFILELKLAGIPQFIISGIFRPDHYFFKGYGKWAANHLRNFSYFFVQNNESRELLKSIGINQVVISGDTRFDRVIAIAGSARVLSKISKFLQNRNCIVAGSTWPEDEEMLLKLMAEPTFESQIIIAPHLVDEERIRELSKKLSPHAQLYSAYEEGSSYHSVLIVDEIGLLSSIYRYASIAFVGGGFGHGIHNILEAAVYGVPVFFGPNYQKFAEARELVESGGAIAVRNYSDFRNSVFKFLRDPELKERIGSQNKHYVTLKTGATESILKKFRDLKLIQ